jgi:ribosome-binding protein aMBF1 (putative translation factor)
MDEYSQAKSAIVEAIDDGKIVKVPEEYALREGLPILRRTEVSFLGKPDRKAAREAEKKEMRSAMGFDAFRKPLKPKPNDVVSSLIDNFHWQISQRRKEMNLSRKQVADKLGVKELDIKMLENGVLPSDDYLLINKVQQFFSVNLRKDGKDFNSSAIAQISKKAIIKPLERENKKETREKVSKDEEISGIDIELDSIGEKEA